MDSLENYAMRVLVDAGCDCYTYGGPSARHIMDDLKEAFPKGMKYPYIDVANAILAMSRPEPIRRKPYVMVFDMPSDCDEIEYDSLEAAQNSAEDTLCEWMAQEMATWKSDVPDQEEKDRWDYMIYNFGVSVRKYDPMTDEYFDVWEPDWNELTELGWKEFGE